MILSCVCAWYRQMLKMFKAVIYVKRDAVSPNQFHSEQFKLLSPGPSSDQK